MGGQKAIAYFYSAFSKLVPATLISTKDNGNPENLSADFAPVLAERNRYLNPFLFFEIKKILKKNNSTHLILEQPFLGWLGILLKLFCNVKLVVRSHNIESLRFKSMGKWWWGILWQYEKITHRNADVNFFITEEDQQYAIDKFKLAPQKCFTITYGIDENKPPTELERIDAKNKILSHYSISNDHTLLFFNGTLDYKPNSDAVKSIINEINPLLLKNKDFKYKIIICGKNLPSSFNNLHDYPNIIYAGFVEDITTYFKGTDIFINPVIDGGGIKTKLVEALGNNLFVVTTKEGALGVSDKVTNHRMKVVDNKDWNLFVEAILNADLKHTSISSDFYNNFYWGHIAEKALNALK